MNKFVPTSIHRLSERCVRKMRASERANSIVPRMQAHITLIFTWKTKNVNSTECHHVRKSEMKNALGSRFHLARIARLSCCRWQLVAYILHADVYLLRNDILNVLLSPVFHWRPNIISTFLPGSILRLINLCFFSSIFVLPILQVYVPTGFEKYSKKYKVREYTVQYSIWDTSGKLKI